MDILGSLDAAKDASSQKDEDAALYQKSARELFESIDKDGDGFIGANELRNYLIVLGHKPTKEEVIKMIEDADQSKKGVLSGPGWPDFEDFNRVIGEVLSQRKNEEETLIHDAFISFGGASGFVSLKAIKDLIERDFELEINTKKLLEAHDLDKSGKIDYNEFRALLMR